MMAEFLTFITILEHHLSVQCMIEATPDTKIER